jgi:DNA polymerase-1
MILLSKELVTIHCEVPVSLDLEKMLTQPPDVSACRALFNELEFTSMLKELAPEEQATPLTTILDPPPEEVSRFVQAAQGKGFAVAFDTTLLEVAAEQVAEAEGEAIEEEEPQLRTMSLFAQPDAPPSAEAAPPTLRIAVSAEPGRVLVFCEGPSLDALRTLLADEQTPKLVHDLKAALRILAAHGATNRLHLAGPVDDVMLYSYLINPTHTTHYLGDVAARFTSRALPVASEELLAASAQAIQTLAPLLKQDIESQGTDEVYRDIDLPLVPVLLRMEEAGVRIDRAVLSAMADRLTVEMHTVSEQIFAGSGHRFNINSPKQLGDVLFNKMNLPKPMKYGKGKVVSTAVDVLEELAQHNEVPRQVLQYRQLAKLKSNYVDSLPLLADAEARVHTTFNQVGTATGRLSSTNPNLQNIPIKTELGREIRAAFIAAPGNLLISADYSQIELRLMAHFSEDPLLVRAFAEGQDIHTLTAAEVFGVAAEGMDKQTRDRAKAVNFGIVYGISPFGLAAQLGIEQNVARLYIETYFARYSGVRRYIDQLLEETRREQKVRTLFGRVRPIPDMQSRNANLRGFAERTAVNTPLQGTAADLIKIAMIRIDRRLKEENFAAKMTLQVHDELLFDVPEKEVDPLKQLVKHEMETVIELKVPIVVDCGAGPNWRDLK